MQEIPERTTLRKLLASLGPVAKPLSEEEKNELFGHVFDGSIHIRKLVALVPFERVPRSDEAVSLVASLEKIFVEHGISVHTDDRPLLQVKIPNPDVRPPKKKEAAAVRKIAKTAKVSLPWNLGLGARASYESRN